MNMSTAEYPNVPLSARLSPIISADVDEKSRYPFARRLHGMGSAFFWATQLLPVPRREAIYAVYAFCRELEDIVDSEASPPVKRALLSDWRNQIAFLYSGQPRHPLTHALSSAVSLYGLRSADFTAIIDGREMDVPVGISAPSLTELDLYCQRVAVAAARLSMRIFGEETSAGERIAAELGRALQLTIILRDLRTDAARQRLYLPRELLHAHGILTTIPGWVLAQPALPDVCRDLALIAGGHYAPAVQTIADCPRQNMRPAAVILGIYHALLHELLARGWSDLARPVRISTWRKLFLLFCHGSTGRCSLRPARSNRLAQVAGISVELT
jgi:phytoene synthase